jgi:hypothetical protein
MVDPTPASIWCIQGKPNGLNRVTNPRQIQERILFPKQGELSMLGDTNQPWQQGRIPWAKQGAGPQDDGSRRFGHHFGFPFRRDIVVCRRRFPFCIFSQSPLRMEDERDTGRGYVHEATDSPTLARRQNLPSRLHVATDKIPSPAPWSRQSRSMNHGLTPLNQPLDGMAISTQITRNKLNACRRQLLPDFAVPPCGANRKATTGQLPGGGASQEPGGAGDKDRSHIAI